MDIANSQSLHIAREVDPKGDRTLGVLTKIDLMDKGTHALDVLNGKEYPLKLGFVGVVCRSQKDLMDRKTIKAAIASEKKFFESDPHYKTIKHLCGIEYLSSRLNTLLNNHIKLYIPLLKKAINEQVQIQKEELRDYGEGLFSEESEENMHSTLLLLLAQYSEFYQSAIEGRSIKNVTSEIKTGARIHMIFHDVYIKSLQELNPYDCLTDDDIRTAILNAKGLKPNLFIPEKAFESLIKFQIGRLLDPSLHCLQLVHSELRNTAIHPDIPELSRFDRLQSRICEIAADLLHHLMEPTEEMIKNLIAIEESYINVNHPDVQIATTAILSLFYKSEQPAVEKDKDPMAKKDLKLKEEVKKEEVIEPKKEEPKKKDSNSNNNNKQWSMWPFGKNKTVSPAGAPNIQLEILEEEQKINSPALKNNSWIMLRPLPEIMRASGDQSAAEQLELTIIKKMLESYFSVLIVRVADLVPKTIMAFLVNESKKKLHSALVQKIYLEKNLKHLLEENLMIAEKRANCKKMIKLLTESQKTLNHYGSLD